ncbi:MAG: hypothetical protein KC800_28150, partial [Candidatus Eremiobacteraeota bacterium]|nr:hypothetical protein [Candidatus Eremiobacteraeota bacterium]
HLTSLYLDAHPELSLPEAAAAVRAGLSIPEGAGTNGLSSLAGSPFAARLFLEKAQQNGGFDAFCLDVIARIDQGEVLAFQVPSSRAMELLTGPKAAREEIRAAGVADFFKFLGMTVGGDLITEGVNSLLGMGLSAIGLNIGTASNLKEIESTLSEVQMEIEQLEKLIENLALTGQVLTNYNAIKAINTELQSQSDELSRSAETAASSLQDPDAFDHGPAAIPNNVLNTMSDLLNYNAETSAHTLLGFLTTTVVPDNMVLTYNQFFGNEVYPKPKSNYAQHFFYSQRQDNWTVGDTHSLQATLDYVRSSAVTAMNLWSESAQLSILPEDTVSGLDSPANALNLVRFGGGTDGVLAGEIQLFGAQNLVPDPVGNAQVYIDLTQNLMWYLQYMDGGKGPQWGGAQSTLTGSPPFQLGPWIAAPKPGDYDYQSYFLDGKLGPSGGWRFPTEQECQFLRDLANADNQFGLERLGFNVPSGSNNRIHLYGRPVPSSFGFYNYYAFDWNTGECHAESATGGGPQWNYMYVRTLPDFSSGDGAFLYISCYGFLPASLHFEGSGQEVGSGSTLPGEQNGLLRVYGQAPGQPTGSALTNLSENSEWTSSDPGIMDFSPSEDNGVVTHWHKPGTVTVTVTHRGASPDLPSGGAQPGEVTSVVGTLTLTSPLTGADTFSSIQVSPYNTGLLAPPNLNDQQTYYLLGFYTGGGVEDISLQATWSALDPNTMMPVNPNVAAFNDIAAPNSLVFGSNANSVDELVIEATYNGQKYQAKIAY